MSESGKPTIHVTWKTVTYRSVFLAVFIVVAILSAGVYFAFPQARQKGASSISSLFSRLGELIAGNAGPAKPGAMSSQQAHFTALDGTVRVKKANGNSWINADYNVPLEKGDVIQTGAEGMAKIVFHDGTNYTVKQDSLIVVEENSANQQQQTNISVAVTTGTVDLATATYVQGSRSQVIVRGATASLAPDSSARVQNDTKTDRHEIVVTKGAAEVVRSGEVQSLTSGEGVSFQTESPRMARIREVAPPTPIAPANMMPIFSSGGPKSVDFSWTAMPNAVGYRLRISRNPYFSSTVVDKKVNTADVIVSGLTEGAYYWVVQSFDRDEKESLESEKNRFTIIPRGKNTAGINLELEPLVQHGHVLELTGKTEVGARVMVNGQEVPVIGNDGIFHYFTPPLSAGESVITITAQNAKGGVNTVQRTVVIQ